MGVLPPRYSFLLNPHVKERFNRCPRCKAATRLRKIPLVVHIDPIGLVLLRKACRLCLVCEMLIAHQAEMDRLINSLRTDQADRPAYLVLGTLDARTWRDGMAGRVTIAAVRDNMADFKPT
jgi:hypothetical protein